MDTKLELFGKPGNVYSKDEKGFIKNKTWKKIVGKKGQNKFNWWAQNMSKM